MDDLRPRVTRLAPSPTGSLHLGNAMSFVVAWLLARQQGWRVVMRIEDLDRPRVKAHAADEALDILTWLGLDWDGPVMTQSDDLAPYRRALEQLRDCGHIYPSAVTRRQLIASTSAPQEGDRGEARHDATHRPDPAARQTLAHNTPLLEDDTHAWRLVVAPGDVRFIDQWLGPQHIDVAADVGDFIVASKAGVPAYQLSVVVDDHRQHVTDIVRGNDLLASTARQLLLHHALGYTHTPRYWHLPLVRGADGRRLAKRHGDTNVTSYRDAGVSAERILGLLGFWIGAFADPKPRPLDALLETFCPAALAPCDITFTRDHHTFLLADA